ncbi:putative plant/F18B3-190 protein [Senna tora]|uniref:Putative plant/F18B3-190 protein n=1 Tax=Senna tora TaxID=362788 RepID=A0A834TUN3_9FABA|nr:putative plant/F18B3-190 protein [Senna tora]
MPTFTAIAFDRLIEPGASKSVDKSAPSSMPVPNSKLDRRNSAPTTKRKAPRPQLKPALYATPEVTPLPDSPSSFPPSPYIINHKRRGPRLLKSLSEANVQSKQKIPDDEMVNGKPKNSDTVIVNSAGDLQVTFSNPEPVKEDSANGIHDSEPSRIHNGDLATGHREDGSSSYTNGSLRDCITTKVAYNLERDGESEDFFDPHDSMSYTSNTDGEDNTPIGHSMKVSTPGGEFFDAWEELSSEGGAQASSPYDVEAELRQMRLSLLMEIEKRKQAEESLNNMQSQWENIRQRLSEVGIILPAGLIAVAEGEQLNSDPVEDLCEQVHVARFVSDAIGRGMARAEVEKEMEAQLDSKNFEIARLLERLRFYEMVNQEMSQRNQEAVEMARRERQRRSRRQRWVWGSITTAIVLGVATIAWSYLPLEKGSSSSDNNQVSEHGDAAK